MAYLLLCFVSKRTLYLQLLLVLLHLYILHLHIHISAESLSLTLYLYKNDKSTGRIYPDFIGENSVLDAKYKRLDEKNISRDDRFQMISYMHVLNKPQGYLLYPTQSATAAEENRELAGLGGVLGTVFFPIPVAATWNEFFSSMQKAEAGFIQKIHSRINNT